MHQIDKSSLILDQQIQSALFPNTTYLGRACMWITDNLIKPIENLVNFIFNRFNDFNLSTFSLDSIRSKLLSVDQVVSATHLFVHSPLVNLGSTCYMNSCLQILASCNTFNELFTKKIEDSDPSRLEKKQSLQSHLAALINKLRSANPSETISYDNLKTLFTLCQALGWHTRAKNASIQADAEEFLTFLQDVFDFDSDDIYTLTFALEMGKNETLSDQVVSYFDKNKECFAQKKSPSFLIVKQSRSIYEGGRLLKVDSLVDVPTEFSLQTFNCPDSNEDNCASYQLEAAICHHSKYSISGHYTAIGRYSDQFYIKYNDNKLPKVLDSLDEIRETCTQLFYRLK
jgi:ubiquitin C-terminal hydrolase